MLYLQTKPNLFKNETITFTIFIPADVAAGI